jgi:hypothetical protein
LGTKKREKGGLGGGVGSVRLGGEGTNQVRGRRGGPVGIRFPFGSVEGGGALSFFGVIAG